MANIRPQRPTPPNEWLHNGAEDYTRIFSQLVFLGKEAQPWEECTNEEKEQWEKDHPQPEDETLA